MSRPLAVTQPSPGSARACGPQVFTLLAECFYLLRATPLSILCVYLIGTLPFVLALMYFVGDMLQNAFALRLASPYALGLGLLFLWMCAWQGRFAEKLLEVRTGRKVPPRRFKAWLRWLRIQVSWQCTAFWVLPIALILTVPFVPMVGFYQSLRVLPELDRDDAPGLPQRAWRQASLWLTNQHFSLAAFALFALVIWINWLTFLTLTPFLLKWFFGIDSLFTRAGLMTQLSITMMLVALALTYLTVDPLLKAYYVLRCFYGEARKTGEDVLVSLHALRPVASVLLLLLVGAGCVMPTLLHAQASDPQGAGEITATDAGPSSAAIDEAIQATLREPRFAWRLPPPDGETAESEGWLAEFFEWVDNLRAGVLEWLEDLFTRSNDRERVDDATPSGSSDVLSPLLLILLVVFVLLAVVLLVRALLSAKVPDAEESLSDAAAAPPDIEIETASADERSRNEWLVLADQFAAQGDFRRAIRAAFLGHLSILAEARFIQLAIHKTNFDYRSELAARAGIEPGLRSSFDASSRLYERVWYGFAPADRQLFQQLRHEVERVDAQLGAPAA
ncbi:MAG: DUF4129 domain-containing protein [Opitutales bacterium]